MRKTTEIMATWQKQSFDSGDSGSLHFEHCKGGYFSTRDNFGLKVIGKTAQEQLAGINLFGGELLVSTVESLTGETRDTSDKSVTYAASAINEKALFTGPFKENTIYSIILSGFCTNAETGFANMAVEYTDGVTATITCIGTNSQKATGIYYTAADKTVKAIVGMWNSVSSTLFYDECGVFEGWITTDGFEEYCGGRPSPNPDYPQPIQKVAQGTTITCGECVATVPCDLYEGDVWYPMSGKVERNSTVFKLDGTESWIRNSNLYGTHWHLRKIGTDFYNGDITRAFCSYAIWGNAYGGEENVFNLSNINDGGEIRINIGREFENITTNEFKAHLGDLYASGVPITIACVSKMPIIEQYDPQPICAPSGTVNVTQEPVDLVADLSATMLVGRGEGI